MIIKKENSLAENYQKTKYFETEISWMIRNLMNITLYSYVNKFSKKITFENKLRVSRSFD